MAKRSVFTEATLEVMGELRKLHEQAKRAKTAPFMQERATLSQEARMVAAMTPEQRATYIQQVGVPHMIEVARRLEREAGSG